MNDPTPGHSGHFPSTVTFRPNISRHPIRITTLLIAGRFERILVGASANLCSPGNLGSYARFWVTA